MYLQEEYLMRHGIEDVPVINHVTDGSLLLKMDKGYLLMTIAWKVSDRHPGSYHINYYTPIHNGFGKDHYFSKITDVEREVEWDEYHSYISNWVRGQIDPVSGDKEILLAMWQVFLFCCDERLVSITTSTLEKLLYRSVDDSTTIDEKFRGYQECLVYISKEAPFVLKAFKNYMLPYVKNYCHWLAKLVKSNNEIHAKQD